MRTLIRHFDALLRRVHGVFEFCDDKTCLLRLQVTGAPHPLHLDGHLVDTDEPVLQLHLWNEHVPPLPTAGPDLAWAARTRRLFVRSLHAVARHMRSDPCLARVHAVGSVTALFSPVEYRGGTRLVQRLGFTVMPYHRPLRGFGEFWENFYSWWLMWAFNAVSLRRRRLIHMRRAEMWMLAGEFLSRYGARETENGWRGETGL